MAAAAVPPVVRARLQRAVDARSEPYQQGNQLYVARPRVLVRAADGAITPAGRVYQELLAARGGGPQRGEHLGWYHHGAPTQQFLGHELARDRSGQRHLVRRWNPAEGRWDFTAAGRRFYEHEQTRIEVNIPAYVHYWHTRRDEQGRRVWREDAYNDDGGQPVTVLGRQSAGGYLHLIDTGCGDLGSGNAQCLLEQRADTGGQRFGKGRIAPAIPGHRG